VGAGIHKSVSVGGCGAAGCAGEMQGERLGGGVVGGGGWWVERGGVTVVAE